MTASATAEPVAGGALPIPLWRLLQAVSACLMAVRAGQSGTAALDKVQAPLRPAVQALMYQVWRSLARAENLRRQLASRAPPPQADALLCAVLALGWRVDDAPYEPFTLVNQAVEAAKRQPAIQAQAGFINGCLRRFLRERDALVARSEQDPVAVWNHPQWWIERLRKDHPQHWQDILRAGQQHAPMTLRVNARRIGRVGYLALLAEQGIDAVAVGEVGVCLRQPLPVQRLPGFDAGLVSVQDAAAQLAAPLLLGNPAAGAMPRVLDACAAPGGKTAHLLERADVDLLALDASAERAARIGRNLDRLGLAARVVAEDCRDLAKWWDGRPFDRILADVPCSASGVVRRHPDAKWLRRAGDIAGFAARQAEIVDALWRVLAPGGKMLYVTCSLFVAENAAQVTAFVGRHADARRLPIAGEETERQLFPDAEHDGFYFALLEKA